MCCLFQRQTKNTRNYKQIHNETKDKSRDWKCWHLWIRQCHHLSYCFQNTERRASMSTINPLHLPLFQRQNTQKGHNKYTRKHRKIQGTAGQQMLTTTNPLHLLYVSKIKYTNECTHETQTKTKENREEFRGLKGNKCWRQKIYCTYFCLLHQCPICFKYKTHKIHQI